MLDSKGWKHVFANMVEYGLECPPHDKSKIAKSVCCYLPHQCDRTLNRVCQNYFSDHRHINYFLSVDHQKYFNLKRQRLFIGGVIWSSRKDMIAEKTSQMQPSLQLRNCSLQPYCCCPSKFDVVKNGKKP